MTIQFDATYENGVLKPAAPLPLKERENVRVTVEQFAQSGVGPPLNAPDSARPSLAERIVARARALPAEALGALPDDLAAQHDHYLYGTPKRPE